MKKKLHTFTANAKQLAFTYMYQLQKADGKRAIFCGSRENKRDA